MQKLIDLIRALRDRIGQKDWKAVLNSVPELLDAMGKADDATAVRQLITGVADGDARDVAVGSAQLVFDVLEGYYGFAHVTVKGTPGSPEDVLLRRATDLCDHVEGHEVNKMTNSPRVAAIPVELLTVLGNIIASLVVSFLRNRGY